MNKIEIAQKAKIHLIMKISAKIKEPGDALIQYGPNKKKLSYEYIKGNVEGLF